MMPSGRPRGTRQARAGLEFAFTTIARANPLVVIWRWRYEIALAIGVPAGMFMLTARIGIVWSGTIAAALAGTLTFCPAARNRLVARAWCIITPHRVRTGCAEAWIHSRRGKIPIVLLTTPQPLGERVRVWCRAGTSAADFIWARELLIAACWAQDLKVTRSPQFAQLVTLDVLRHGQGHVT